MYVRPEQKQEQYLQRGGCQPSKEAWDQPLVRACKEPATSQTNRDTEGPPAEEFRKSDRTGRSGIVDDHEGTKQTGWNDQHAPDPSCQFFVDLNLR